MGIAVSGETLHEAEARMEICGERRAAGGNMWRKWASHRVWGLVLKTVVASVVTKGAQRIGGRGTDGWRRFGTGWAGRPKKERDLINRAPRGGVDNNGCMAVHGKDRRVGRRLDMDLVRVHDEVCDKV